MFQVPVEAVKDLSLKRANAIKEALLKQYTDLDQLYLEASKQIENDADRKKFLQTRPRP